MMDNKGIGRFERTMIIFQYVVIAGIIMALVSPFLFWYLFQANNDGVRALRMDNLRVEGSSQLCPGDDLLASFDFHGEGKGAVMEVATWFQVNPPQTLIAGELSYYILNESLTRKVYRHWTIPETYTDERTGELVPLAPGVYNRLYTLLAVGYTVVVDVKAIEFVIRDDCP